MTEQPIQLKENLSPKTTETEQISQIFLKYLDGILDESKLAQYYTSNEFERIISYSPDIGWIAFKDLVNLSLLYLNKPIQTVLQDFSSFSKNYRFQIKN